MPISSMNLHLKRGLIAFLLASGIVLIYGAIDIYLDPPVDVPSVGYWAYWLLVKAVLAVGIGFGLTMLALVTGGSWLIASAGKTWVKIGLVSFALLIGGAIYFLEHPFSRASTKRYDDYSKGKVQCCTPHK